MKWVPFMPLELALAMFGILSLFSVLGGALYERRHELGLDTRKSPEQTEELARRDELRENHALVTEAYGQMRAGSNTPRLGRCSRSGSPHAATPSPTIIGCVNAFRIGTILAIRTG